MISGEWKLAHLAWVLVAFIIQQLLKWLFVAFYNSCFVTAVLSGKAKAQYHWITMGKNLNCMKSSKRTYRTWSIFSTVIVRKQGNILTKSTLKQMGVKPQVTHWSKHAIFKCVCVFVCIYVQSVYIYIYIYIERERERERERVECNSAHSAVWKWGMGSTQSSELH